MSDVPDMDWIALFCSVVFGLMPVIAIYVHIRDGHARDYDHARDAMTKRGLDPNDYKPWNPNRKG